MGEHAEQDIGGGRRACADRAQCEAAAQGEAWRSVMRRIRGRAVMMVMIVLMVLVGLGVLRGARDFPLCRSAGGSERHGRQLQQGRNGEQRSPGHAQPSCSLPGHMH